MLNARSFGRHGRREPDFPVAVSSRVMRGGPGGRNRLGVVTSFAVTIVAAGFALTRSSPHVPERDVEPAWEWDDEARLICLTIPGGARTESFDADLLIDGTLIGFGELSAENRDVGNVVGCEDYPARFIDVRDDEGKTWRMMYALFGLGYPTLNASVGSRVHFRFYSFVRAGRTADLLLTDERGPVLAMEQGEYGPRDLEGMRVSVSWGRSLEHRGPNTSEGWRLHAPSASLVIPMQ